MSKIDLAINTAAILTVGVFAAVAAIYVAAILGSEWARSVAAM